MNEIAFKINMLAQGLVNLDEGVLWFTESSDVEQAAILNEFCKVLLQSHPSKREIEIGIVTSDLKLTYSPCVVMLSNPLNVACKKILAMPKNEWVKTFRLWLGVFSESDRRRRETECKSGCSHEWHNIQKS